MVSLICGIFFKMIQMNLLIKQKQTHRFFFLICKVCIEFVTILLLFYVLVFWPCGLWILSSQNKESNTTSALEGEFLTTGPPGNSLTDLEIRLMVIRGEMWGEVINQENGINIYILLYIKQITKTYCLTQGTLLNVIINIKI